MRRRLTSLHETTQAPSWGFTQRPFPAKNGSTVFLVHEAIALLPARQCHKKGRERQQRRLDHIAQSKEINCFFVRPSSILKDESPIQLGCWLGNIFLTIFLTIFLIIFLIIFTFASRFLLSTSDTVLANYLHYLVSPPSDMHMAASGFISIPVVCPHPHPPCPSSSPMSAISSNRSPTCRPPAAASPGPSTRSSMPGLQRIAGRST